MYAREIPEGFDMLREITPAVRARVALSIVSEPGDELLGALVNGFGAVQVAHWLNTDPEATFAREEYREAIRRARTRGQGQRLDEMVADVLNRVDRDGIYMLIPEDLDWPRPLTSLGERMPFILYTRGAHETLSLELERYVSIVGARAATSYGDHIAQQLASDLAPDFHVVSGAAYGIDGAAHRGAILAGGRTIAILAGGVDRIYPAGHSALGDSILQSGGAFVSEVPPGSAPTKWRFLARNRLIAAMGAASIVVEAGFRSGSLNEAGHALALGRKLGAVPGPVTSAASAGTHRLIREYGATLITSADDVRELVGTSRKDRS